jgi:NosR/NirI family nitrous oxide reductase transcriptional regulator
MFEWLKRYKECGAPCQRCGNECLYCLHCQVVYSDNHVCPVLIQKRLKRERQTKISKGDKSGVALKVEEIKNKAKAKAVTDTASDQVSKSPG